MHAIIEAVGLIEAAADAAAPDRGHQAVGYDGDVAVSVYCTGDVAGCDICAHAALGRDAARALAQGDYAAALALVEQAADRAYCPGEEDDGWETAVEAVRALAE